MVKHDESDEPVQLTEDEVISLTRGQMPDERIASLLEGGGRALAPREADQRSSIADAEREGGERGEGGDGPVEIRAEEIEALAAGREVESVNARIEKGAERGGKGRYE